MSIEEIYRAENKKMWRSLYAYTGDRELTSDAVAEAFTQAIGHKGTIKNARAWVWKTAYRIAAGALKTKKQTQASARTTEQKQVDTPHIDFLDQLQTISDQQRIIVALRYIAEFKPSEIATLLGSSPESVRVQLHRAHKTLKKSLDQDSPASTKQIRDMQVKNEQ